MRSHVLYIYTIVKLLSIFTGIYILDIVPRIVAASAVSGDWTDIDLLWKNNSRD